MKWVSDGIGKSGELNGHYDKCTFEDNDESGSPVEEMDGKTEI